MTTYQIISLVIAVLTFLGVGKWISSRFDRMEKQNEARNMESVDENMLIIRGIQSVGDLSEATAIAQKCGHTNGETEIALKQHAEFRKDLNQYFLKQNARNHGR
jgi:hypothetical protein